MNNSKRTVWVCMCVCNNNYRRRGHEFEKLEELDEEKKKMM